VAWPARPAWPGLDRVAWLDNTSVLQLDRLPRHLLVAGGSYIGLEFAQAYRRLGAQVTLVEAADRLVPREDPAVSQALQALLEGEGVRILTGISAVQLAPAADGGIALTLAAGGRTEALEASHLLLATGRRPNTDDLGLAEAGIRTDARGYVIVDDALRTSAEGVWALGDCNGRGAFTHTSYHDHEVVVANLLGPAPRSIGERVTAYALFTDPPLARAGLSAEQARASGRRHLIGTLPMARVGRAKERGETTGFLQVLVDADTRRITGATLFGIEADEAIHGLLLAMSAGLACDVLQRCVPIHPTVSELLPSVLGALQPLDPEVLP